MRRRPGSLHDGLAYVVSGGGSLACIEAKSGQTKWSIDMVRKFGGRPPQWNFAESVLIDGEHAICTPGGPDAGVVALKRATGEVVWKSRDLGRSSYCAPLLVEHGGRRAIVTMMSESIVGLDAGGGELLWSHPFRNRWAVHANTPVFADGMVYTSGGYEYGGLMLKLGADGRSAAKGWTNEKPDVHHGGLVLHEGHIYATASKGGLCCIELARGKLLYQETSVGKGSTLWADGLFYCYSEKGNLDLVQADPKGARIVSTMKITKGTGEHWAHPVISDGKLYVRHGDAMMVYAVK